MAGGTDRRIDEKLLSVMYPIEKALFYLNGGNCSKERVGRMFQYIDLKERNVLFKLLQYVNNSYFDYYDLFTWIVYRYLVRGKMDFPQIDELDFREISRSRKEFYKSKLNADRDFLILVCRKIGKDEVFLRDVNTRGESNLFSLYKNGKIGIYTMMEMFEPNVKNKEETTLKKRIDKVKQLLQNKGIT